MRSYRLILAGLAGLAALMPPPVAAATSFNCARASTIIGYTAAGRGVRVELLWGVTEPAKLEALLRRYGWDRLIGEADAMHLNYAVPSRYLLMASKNGCHVAHVFLEEAQAKALMAE
jgi:hypothetical protein